MGTQDTAHEQRCGAHAGPPAAGRPLEPPHGGSRRPLFVSHRRHAPRPRGVAHLGPPHARPGDRRGLRLALHRAARLRLRGRRDEPPDGLPVHRHAAALLRRRRHLRLDGPRAGSRAHGADPRRADRRALRRRARHEAGHRADRRARKPGPLARVAPAHPARGRRAAGNPGAHDVRERHRHRRGLSHGQGLARPHLRRLRVRGALLLPAARPVVLGDQERLLRGRRHHDPVLPGLQHTAGGRGGGARDHDRGGRRVGRDPDARRAHHQAAAGREMIELLDVHKRFLENVVLDGVSLEVKDGETVALLGPSGVGKSVTLKMINGLLRPDAGDVIVDGLHVPQLGRKELATLRGKIGYVFQYGALFDSMSVAENIRLGITDETCYNDEKFCENRIQECLRLVNLAPDVAAKLPAELSGGMKKRVGIARAIAGQPKYLLYDEPTSGLDPVNADVIDGLVDPVRVSGVKKGRVGNVRLERVGHVTVTLNLDPEVRPHKDARAIVASADFLGAKYVDYDPGLSDSMLPPRANIQGVTEEQFADVAQGAAKSAQELIANVNKGLNPGQLATDIHATLIATQRGMDALTKATNGPVVQQTQATLKSLEGVMAHLDTLLGAANPAQTGKRLDTLSTNLAQLTSRLPDATGSLKGLLDKMDKGEGTLGRMATDTMLYKNLNATLKSLSELLTDLKERPGRYLTVKVF